MSDNKKAAEAACGDWISRKEIEPDLTSEPVNL